MIPKGVGESDWKSEGRRGGVDKKEGWVFGAQVEQFTASYIIHRFNGENSCAQRAHMDFLCKVLPLCTLGQISQKMAK